MTKIDAKTPAYLYQAMSKADLIDLSRSIGFKSMPQKPRDGAGAAPAYTLSGFTTPEAARQGTASPPDGSPTFILRVRQTSIPDLQSVVEKDDGRVDASARRPFVVDLYQAEVLIAHPQTKEAVWMPVALYRLAAGELSAPAALEGKGDWKPKMSRGAWFAMKRRLGQLQPRRAA